MRNREKMICQPRMPRSALLPVVFAGACILLTVATVTRHLLARAGEQAGISGSAQVARVPIPQAAAPACPDAASQSAGADASWWQGVAGDIARREYAPTPRETGLQAPNRAQNFRTTFGADGIDVVPRTEEEVAPAWRFTWQTTAVGRADNMHAAATVVPNSEGSRVIYRHDGWSEWYENSPKGLEQGFTLENRPAGDGPLRIVGAYPSELRAEMREDGAVDFIDAHGACVLRYGELHVTDARGDSLAARLQVEDSELALVIEDCDASYPLTVDPLLSAPSWTGDSGQTFSLFGASVMTAGDVNGDGYSDVIVGASAFDNGQTDEGRAFVYYGSAAGLSVTANWTAEGDQAGARFGAAVATAGDVNGDGFGDVIIGAWGYDNGQSDEGRTFVYLGSAAGLSATPVWTAESDQASSGFGYQVATAGDVNGDGYSDVMVGAYRFDNGQTDEGRAYVYHGSASGVSPTASWTGESNQASSEYGESLATAGDVNGDGFSDVIVGAQFFNNGDIGEGRAFVYHGSAGGLSVSATWTAEGNQFLASFGTAVSTAGDVNGDGYADVIVGASFFDNGQVDEGRAFVFHGSASGLGASAAWTAEADLAGAQFGHQVTTAGDVNGDGYSDVIVAALATGRAYAYQGSPQGLGATPIWAAESNQGANSGFGVSLATAGDVNGDGFSDVIVGANLYDNGTADEGAAFVYLGSSLALATVPAWTAEVNQANSGFGYSVRAAGDVNGDGYGDVIVGAPGFNDGVTHGGAAFLYLGSASGLANTPAWTARNDNGHLFGHSVGTAGDVNGDGYSDVIVGAPWFENDLPVEGAVFVYAGSPAGLGTEPVWMKEGDQAYSEYAWSVGTAGDVNGDGYSDVIVGGREYDNGEIFEGHAFVYHGSPSGLLPTPSWLAQGNQNFAGFGYAVGTAGDVNGDGFSDVIVGAPVWTDFVHGYGRSFVYLGSEDGLAATASWTAQGSELDDLFGSSVATAGDVNGDGFSDVIVGAPHGDTGMATMYYGSPTGLSIIPDWSWFEVPPGFSYGCDVQAAGDINGDGFGDVVVGANGWINGGLFGGSAFIYLGSAIGLATNAARELEGTQNQAYFGNSAATAGDVNGDGYSDIVVGAPDFDNGQNNEGTVFFYFGNGVDGIDRTPRQMRTDDAAPIGVLGASDSQSAVLLKTQGRSAAGRGRVRVEYEVKPFGTTFNNSGIIATPWLDTGSPTPGVGSATLVSKLIGNLNAGELYHWRLRYRSDSPFFPGTRWLTQPDNNQTEADFRTKAAQSGADDVPTSPGAQLLAAEAWPNPFSATTEVRYTLPQAGPVRVAVYDATGRECAVLFDGAQPAGAHRVSWDGRRANGRRLPTGVYFARIATGGRSVSQRVVLVP